MGHIEGASRVQQILFPEALDDYITEDSAARFIDAFVDSLDLHALGFNAQSPHQLAVPRTPLETYSSFISMAT